MIHDLLTKIGLSEKEATMYMTLLRYGMQRTSFLAEKAHLNRGTAHVILHALLGKGLIVKTTKRSIHYFSALDPTQLVTYLDHKKQEFEHAKEKVNEVMGQLLAIKNPHTAKPKIEFFEGMEGARAVLENTLTAKEPLLRAFLSIADIIDSIGPEFFNDYTTKRVQRGPSLHAIRTLEKDKEALAKDVYAKRYMTSKKERREIRHCSESLAFPITMYMYDNKLAIISSKEENFSLLIESKELADMQKKLFDLLWASLKK